MLSKNAYQQHIEMRLAKEASSLNSEQQDAYNSTEHCVVKAGPGSGKTRLLTLKMAKVLAQEVRNPRGIACVTYNAECARELQRRLYTLGVYESHEIFIGTVHAFCLDHIVRPYAKLAGFPLPEPFQIALDSTQNEILNLIAPNIDKNLKEEFKSYRRTFLDRESDDWHNSNSYVALLVESYEQKLHSEGWIDFDDMVLWGLRIIQQHEWVRRILRAKFPVIFVDEYQDLGKPLHHIVLNLCFEAGIRLFAVGDPDQSIYGFNGAHPELLLELAQRSDVSSVQLRLNYRFGTNIIAASQIVLGEKRGYDAANNSMQEGIIHFHDPCTGGLEEQAEKICKEIVPSLQKKYNYGNIAILYIDRHDGEVIAKEVEASKILSIRIDQGAPYQKTRLTRWLEDCASWCSGEWKTQQPTLSELFRKWYQFNRQIDGNQENHLTKKQLVRFLYDNRFPEMPLFEWLTKFHANCLSQLFEHQPTLADEREQFEKILKASSPNGEMAQATVKNLSGQRGSPDHLNLVTLHSAKGSEFDVVIIPGLEQGRIPWLKDRNKSEKRRQFYVGITRAKYEVHLLHSGWYSNRNNYCQKEGPSEFLKELKEKLK